MSLLRVVVRQLRWEARGVVSLVLEDAAGGELPAWQPGAHVSVHLPSGETRQYSLCGDPADRHGYRIAVLDVPGGRGGSREVHERIRVGQELDVEPPRNHFSLEEAGSYLFIAGGIGITPILPMVQEIQRRNLPWQLVYGGRSRCSMAFLDELPEREPVSVVAQDTCGAIDVPAVLEGADGATVYCCGPEPLLAAVQEAATESSSVTAVRVERFEAASQAPARPARSAEEAAPVRGGGTRVVLSRSGRTVDVAPGCTLLDSLREAGIEVPTSCEQGICGTCETKVLAGVPDHRDSVLTAAEHASGTSMMLCVSGCASTELTLDL